MLLLAPDSRLATWDYLNTSTFGPDVAFINASMAAVFGRYRVDPTQLAIEGFSDGATYALILGAPACVGKPGERAEALPSQRVHPVAFLPACRPGLTAGCGLRRRD